MNVLLSLLLPMISGEAVLVPVPTSAREGSDPWYHVLDQLARELGPSSSVLPALRRQKLESTRTSMAQVRSRIVEREYSLVPELARDIADRIVYVVDDNVTTGATLVHCCRLLSGALGRAPTPLALDRTVSARIRQRCPELLDTSCEHQQPRGPIGGRFATGA